MLEPLCMAGGGGEGERVRGGKLREGPGDEGRCWVCWGLEGAEEGVEGCWVE